jgi:hypothetical protein
MQGSSRATIRISGKGPPAAPLVYPPWWTEDERVIPVTVEWDRVLIDKPRLAAYVGGLRVFPSGFAMELTATVRPDGSGLRDLRLERRVNFQSHSDPRMRVTPDELAAMFRVGVQFADGRQAAVGPSSLVGLLVDPRAELPLAQFAGGGWTLGLAHVNLRVHGIPEQGDVTLFSQWLEFGVAEASVVIDGDTLRAAAARATVLWEHPGG